MTTRSQRGEMNMAAIIAVTMTLLFMGMSAFGIWAFTERQDYKNNAASKIAAAVEVAEKQTATKKDNEFAEASKSPTKTFNGSVTFGSVSFAFPKTYSAYVTEKASGGTPADGYFHPNIVPSISDTSVSFALRYRIVDTSYDSILKSFQANIKSGKVKVSAFKAAKVPQSLGSRLDGQLTSTRTGSMILLPLRDKTIEIWTESDQYKADFNTYVVPSISFVP